MVQPQPFRDQVQRFAHGEMRHTDQIAGTRQKTVDLKHVKHGRKPQIPTRRQAYESLSYAAFIPDDAVPDRTEPDTGG